MEMLFVPLNLCFPAIFIQSVLLLSMAGFMWYITIVNGYFRSSLGKMIQMPCHGTPNRLEASPLSMASSYPLSENGQRTLSRHGYSSVGSRSCWNRIYYPFASVTNALQSRVWSSSQSFNHWILLGIPQTRFRPSGFSWMPPSVLAYTTEILIKESKRYSFNRI